MRKLFPGIFFIGRSLFTRNHLLRQANRSAQKGIDITSFCCILILAGSGFALDETASGIRIETRMCASPRNCSTLVLIGCGILMLCAGCETTKETQKSKITVKVAPAPSPKPAPVKPVKPRPTPEEEIKAAFARFAKTVATRGVKHFVILPFAEPGGRMTVLSKHLAGMMADSLCLRGLERLERENLADLFAEVRMSEMGGAGNLKTARVMGADLLVVGESALAAAKIAIKVRAIEVANTRVLHEGRWSVRSDKNLRALAFQVVRSAEKDKGASSDPGDVGRLWEEDGYIFAAEQYAQPGASQGRLLDRVKQKIRKRFYAYCRQVLLLQKSTDELEDLFKRGEVEDAAFDPGKVYLKMKFRKPSGGTER